MTRLDAFRLGRKLLILTLLVAGVGYVGSDDSAARKTKGKALICCSACDVDVPPPPCRWGCSPSC